MAMETLKLQTAKTELREALATYGGDTKNEIVARAIEKLSSLNPTTSPALSAELMDSDWLLISAPNFPDGKQGEDGKYIYTLGRLAFNMFQPVELKLAIERVSLPIFVLENGPQRSYDILVEFTITDEKYPQLQGIVRNLGVCEPINDRTLEVKFTGGLLMPQDSTNLASWQSIFGNQGGRRNKSAKDKLMSIVFKSMFGLAQPEGMNPETGEVSFSMRRSPKGQLEIIYLDEELRITRGKRGKKNGTILVCERKPS